MTILIYILVLLAVWHFAYEGILAPALRHNLRYDFFKLRDRLRRTDHNNNLNKNDKVAYAILDESICHMIESMAFINLAKYISNIQQVKHNSKVKQGFNNIRNCIESSENKELKLIDKKIAVLGVRGLIINHGGWSIYLALPILTLIALLYLGIKAKSIKNYIKQIVVNLIYSPIEEEHNNIAMI